MIFKDKALLEEAYISATQKTPNVVPNLSQVQADAEVPPISMTLTNEPQEEPHGSLSHQDSGCGCEESEEYEEDYMTKSNLFSIFCNAKKLHNLCMSHVEMEPWMQQKIAICADNLEAVMRSASYDAAINGVDTN